MSVTPIMTAESNHKIVNEIYWRTWVHNIFEFSSADSAYFINKESVKKGTFIVN